MAFTVLVSVHIPVLTPWLAAFALLVAASRLILGLNDLSDVLVGALIGGTLALAGLYLASLI